GSDAQRLLIVARQHFSRLRLMRAEIDTGAGPVQVISRATPRIHFSRMASNEHPSRLSSDEALSAACALLAAAIADSRNTDSLGLAIGRQAMLAVCMAAARR